jgi:GNAT superfamily N-acetyltransferase
MNSTDWAEYMTFDRPRAQAYLEREIEAGTTPHVLALNDEADIVGVGSYQLSHDFTVKPIAVMQEIWAREDYRRTPLGRVLLSLIIDLAQADGATVLHAPVASGLASARSLKNLFLKNDFHEFGYMMRRRL